ncbi:glycine zipper 2TM domain-containing protein [Chitinivorax sp. B]|uniref:glycine zipper 2TM domain-containing protein n=1 Tax=Chitinivorax sp. B TaxID=2502235 RepID=UPI0010F8F568|nr:glycine zipper 2TM domain-containing protein [Chitinivorax sp. B]
MMQSHKLVVLTLLTGSIALGGCASGLTGDTYSRDDARVEQSVRHAVVTGVRPVVLEGESSQLGVLGGAALGGIAGSEMGKGRGSAAGAIAGAIVGGIAGAAIEKSSGTKQGVEVTVKLADGREVAIVQEASSKEMFRPGDKVRLLSRGGTTRVTPE